MRDLHLRSNSIARDASKFGRIHSSLTEAGSRPNEKEAPTTKSRGLFRRVRPQVRVELSLSKHCRNFAVRATHGEAGQFLESGKLLMSLTYR
jgi:hypothetical protein